MSPVVCVAQPPTRIICERLFGRGRDVERGPHRSQTKMSTWKPMATTLWVTGANKNSPTSKWSDPYFAVRPPRTVPSPWIQTRPISIASPLPLTSFHCWRGVRNNLCILNEPIRASQHIVLATSSLAKPSPQWERDVCCNIVRIYHMVRNSTLNLFPTKSTSEMTGLPHSSCHRPL